MNRVKQFGNDPIILVTNPTYLSAQVIQKNQQEITDLLEQFDGYAVIMIDLRDVDVTFDKYINILRDEDSMLYHNNPVILIGSKRFLQSYRDAMRDSQSNDTNVSVYHDFSKAISTARKHLKKLKREGETVR